MAVTPQNESKARISIREIEESELDSESKNDLIEMVDEAKISTNGLTPEEKLQAVSENQFRMVRCLARSIVSAAKPKVRTWKDVIVECKAWLFPSLCIGLAIIASAFVLKPELAQIAASVHANRLATQTAAPFGGPLK